MPVLQRILSEIRQIAPALCAPLEKRLLESGSIEKGTTIGKILRYAERTTGKSMGLVELQLDDQRWLVASRASEVLRDIHTRAVRLAQRCGGVTAQQVVLECKCEGARYLALDQIEKFLCADPALRSVKTDSTWYFLQLGDESIVERLVDDD